MGHSPRDSVLSVFRLGVLALLVGCAPALAPWSPPGDRILEGWGHIDEVRAAELQSKLDAAIAEQDVPGLQAALVDAEGVAWFGAAGTADWGREEPLGRQHAFRIASASKLFTSALTWMAVEEGVVGLDTAVQPWAPDLPNAERITVGQLLGHRSGARELLEVQALVATATLQPGATWTPNTLLKKVSAKTARSEPGSDFAYSNTNFLVLGLMLQDVLGAPLHELVAQRITQPLGLQRVRFLPQDEEPEGLVVGHDRDLIPVGAMHKLKPGHTSWASLAWSSGSIASDAADLATFAHALFTGGLLQPSSVAGLVDFRPIEEEGMPGKTGCGLGAFRTELDGRELWGHEGLFIGFQATVLHDPVEELTLVVLGNVSEFDVLAVASQLLGQSRR